MEESKYQRTRRLGCCSPPSGDPILTVDEPGPKSNGNPKAHIARAADIISDEKTLTPALPVMDTEAEADEKYDAGVAPRVLRPIGGGFGRDEEATK